MYRVSVKPFTLFNRFKWLSWFSLGFLVLFGALVGAGSAFYLQKQAFEHQITREAQSILQRLNKSVETITQQFQAISQYAKSSEYNPDVLPVLMAHIAETMPMVHYTALAYRLENQVALRTLVARKQAEGFESFHLKHQLLQQVYQPEAGRFVPYAQRLEKQTQPVLLAEVAPYTPEAQALLGEQIEWPREKAVTRIVKFAHHTGPTLLYTLPIGRHEALNVHLLLDVFMQQDILKDPSQHQWVSLAYQPEAGRPLPLFHLATHAAEAGSLWEVQRHFSISLWGLPFEVTLAQDFHWGMLAWGSLLVFALGGGMVGALLWWVIKNTAEHYVVLTDAKKRLDQLVHKAHDALIVTDASGRILEWSDRAKALVWVG